LCLLSLLLSVQAQSGRRKSEQKRTPSPVDATTALARYLAAWIGPAAALIAFVVLQPRGVGAHAAWLIALNFLWACIDPERQFLHDRIAGTRIAHAPER